MPQEQNDCQGFLESFQFGLQNVALFCPRGRVHTKQWSAVTFCYIVLSHSGSLLPGSSLVRLVACQVAALGCSKDHIRLAEAWAEKEAQTVLPSVHKWSAAIPFHLNDSLQVAGLLCCRFYQEVGTGWVAKAQSSTWTADLCLHSHIEITCGMLHEEGYCMETEAIACVLSKLDESTHKLITTAPSLLPSHSS